MIHFSIYTLGATNAYVFAWDWFHSQTDSNTAIQAAKLSVHQRLPHHLLPNTWNWWSLGLALFICTALVLRLPEVKWRVKLQALFISSLLLYALGWVFWFLDWDQGLNFYPFRVPDVLIPILAAVGLCVNAAQRFQKLPPSKIRLVSFAFMVMVAGVATLHLTRNVTEFSGELEQIDFEAYRWIRENTPRNALFLVAPGDRVFTVLTERASVVNFKMFPQLASQILEWRERIETLGCPLGETNSRKNEKLMDKCYLLKSKGNLARIADRFQADWIMSRTLYANADSNINLEFASHGRRPHFIYKVKSNDRILE